MHKMTTDIEFTRYGKVDIKKHDILDGNGTIFYNLLNPHECDDLINKTEKIGFKPLRDYPEDYRNNKRILCNSMSITDEIWHRVSPYLKKK